jgi:hypothetical protein
MPTIGQNTASVNVTGDDCTIGIERKFWPVTERGHHTY